MRRTAWVATAAVIVAVVLGGARIMSADGQAKILAAINASESAFPSLSFRWHHKARCSKAAIRSPFFPLGRQHPAVPRDSWRRGSKPSAGR